MNRRRIAVAAIALLVLSGCSSDNDEAKPAASPTDGARQAVTDYISALNTRSTTGLIRIGGVKDEPWSRREAAKILADKGGRGWKISDLEINHDMGPNTGSAHLAATDKAGKPMNDTFTVTRGKGTWHLVVFTGQPTSPGKTPASTGTPTAS
ncbi:hypothetical protein JK361_35185 [Streptomyces sp. 5-8]|uniref:Lipoprotein n=1 Tax=Streptomyces musisoli TaxID=2802280 RepID=A0ABS1PCI0_9ACTN|nr:MULTISPECIES: hypothetical protein [Streptomyces]MBL1109762.1 hypothetical protein [Streptomyces musisoli]MBY8846733.1 hypothetical protein [Streptomyces sp. SP2-10]